MSKKATASAAMTTTTADEQSTGASMALAQNDDLAGLDFDIGDDGLGEIEREDIKIAAYVINMKGKDQNGRKLPEDSYYNTVDETTKRDVDAAFLHLHKTNLFAYYDNDAGKTRTVCRSFDRVTGEHETEGTLKCDGCKYAQWRSEGGKRTRDCGPVYNVFAVDRETQQPFVVRFKKTSMPVIKSYLQKHFIGRRVLAGGKRTNYPLFAFQTRMGCTMSDDGKYALPVLQRGELLSAEEIKAWSEQQQYVRDNVVGLLNNADRQAAAHEGAEPDTSFDTDKFAAQTDEGKDFIDAPAG